ncbi:hypothetical protein NC652_041767 [Populus alba x Populus x berolinensis]|nr:hypothetical protein NC652_041767 [Populus alba x Populus x berolinensis]
MDVKKGALESRRRWISLREHIEKYGLWKCREIPKFAGLSRCGQVLQTKMDELSPPGCKTWQTTPKKKKI